MVYEKTLWKLILLGEQNIFEQKSKAYKFIKNVKILKENLPQNIYQPCKDIYTLPINIK